MDPVYSNFLPAKPRNVERACDACRRRKSKCDGPKMPNNVCTTCIQSGRSCTYLEPSKPRGPSKAFVTGLEDRLEQLEALLQQLHPDKDYSKQLGPPVVRDSWKDQDQQPPWSAPLPFEIKRSTPTSSTRRPSEDIDSDSSDDSSTILDVFELESISGSIQKLTLRGEEEPAPQEKTEEAHARFHGKSSSVGLVGVTQAFKMMHMLEHDTKHDARLGSPDSVGSSTSTGSTSGPTTHRPKFWKMPERERQWEERNMNTSDLIANLLSAFPPADLIPELISVYFLHSNYPLPLLHRPTFERQYKENLHHANVWFAAVCLGIFSIASRWSNDIRVIPEGATVTSGAPDWSLAGWQYCKAGLALHEVRRRLFCPTTLFELQSHSLFATYLRDSAHRPLTWILVGTGLRKAQDIGVQRKKVFQGKSTGDNELWKRAFWCLLVLDRFESAAIGRSALVGEEDFDIELPLEVDDEYWETDDPSAMFVQPEGVPAKISAFNQIIKLTRYLAFALKTLYAVDKQKISFGLSPSSWRRAILEHLDSGLNKWCKSLPEHLVWSKQKDGSPFAVDAAVLQTSYLLIQMLIYQMFIPSPITRPHTHTPSRQQSPQPPLPFSPLDVCVEAARDCANISQKQSLEALSTWPIYIYASQVASTILLVKFWDVKAHERAMRTEGVEDIKPPMLILEPLRKDLEVFLNILELAKPRWGFVPPYLQELKEAFPDASGNFPVGDALQPQFGDGGGIVDFRVMESQRLQPQQEPHLHSSYPAQPLPQPGFYSSSANSLPQPHLLHPSHSMLQRSQHRPSYPPPQSSISQYPSSQVPSQIPRLAPLWTEPQDAPRVRAEERVQHLTPIDFTPAEHRRTTDRRHHTGDMPLLVRPSYDHNLSYNSGRRRLDEGLELPFPYDRALPGDAPPNPPRTLQTARSLPLLGNSLPLSSHDTNAHRARERQKATEPRFGDSTGFNNPAIRQAPDAYMNLTNIDQYPTQKSTPVSGPYAKQNVSYIPRTEYAPQTDWSHDTRKTTNMHSVHPDMDSEPSHRGN